MLSACRAILGLTISCCAFTVLGEAGTNQSVATLQIERSNAVSQVEKIVNQVVPAYPRKPGMHVATFKEGWFHPGAHKPDFDTVDVRTTRETPYDQYQYVTSDLNPGLVFIGNQLEFNSNTKYFYKNRSVPKKKLSEPEMLEINRLYRIIGHCDDELERLQSRQSKKQVGSGAADSSTDAAPANQTLAISDQTRYRLAYGGAALLGVAVVLWFVTRLRRR